MKKLIVTLLMGLILVLFTPLVWAQGAQQQNKAQDQTTHLDGSPTPQGNQVQTQNQIQTQNQGEEIQLQVAAQQMEQLMEIKGLNEEVGNQLKVLSQEQVQAKTQIQTQLNKVESRSNFVKKILGPDYGAIKNLKQQLEQNRLRVQQLQQLQSQVINQADEIQLEAVIQALTQVNVNLEDQIQAEEQVGSIFGWLIRLFYR